MTVVMGILGLVGAGMRVADTHSTTLTVTPNTNLPDVASVNVSGAGFGNSGSLALQQCIPIDQFGSEDCSENINTSPIQTSPNGAFGPVAVQVSRVFTAAGTQRTC